MGEMPVFDLTLLLPSFEELIYNGWSSPDGLSSLIVFLLLFFS